MRLASAAVVAALLPAISGCDLGGEDRALGAGSLGSSSHAATICAPGAQTFGIDVSKWQGQIDWQSVAGDGVEFAFIRVSDGLDYQDEYFDRNWRQAREQGILRGAYQFFRPNLDPVAQADLLLATMGPLEDDDLPPVIDVEVDGGQSPAAIASGVRQWIDRVEGQLGVKPIIYTGSYFWDSALAGTDEFRDYPLWVAHWTSGDCPSITDAWSNWGFWQYSATGRVAGIGGDVDLNRFNGDRQALIELGGGESQPCEILPAEGGVLDDDGACFRAGGPPQYIRSETGGHGGGYKWTVATDFDDTSNYGEWSVHVAESGVYQLEAYVEAGAADSSAAVYRVESAEGERAITIDQTAAGGWTALEEVVLEAGEGYRIRLDDNTGEPYDDARRLVFDAVRVTRVSDEAAAPSPEIGGCAAAGPGAPGGAAALMLLGLAGLWRRRIARTC